MSAASAWKGKKKPAKKRSVTVWAYLWRYRGRWYAECDTRWSEAAAMRLEDEAAGHRVGPLSKVSVPRG